MIGKSPRRRLGSNDFWILRARSSSRLMRCCSTRPWASCALLIASAAGAAITRRISASATSNRLPSRRLITSSAPIAPFAVDSGAHRIERVTKPVSASTLAFTRASPRASRTTWVAFSETARPTTPCPTSTLSPLISTGPTQMRHSSRPLSVFSRNSDAASACMKSAIRVTAISRVLRKSSDSASAWLRSARNASARRSSAPAESDEDAGIAFTVRGVPRRAACGGRACGAIPTA